MTLWHSWGAVLRTVAISLCRLVSTEALKAAIVRLHIETYNSRRKVRVVKHIIHRQPLTFQSHSRDPFAVFDAQQLPFATSRPVHLSPIYAAQVR